MCISVDEAAKKWGIKPEAVLRYIYNGYIEDLTVTDNKVYLPDIPRPYLSRLKDQKNTADKICSAILKAYNNQMFLNPCLLSISREKFDFFLCQLEKSGYIDVCDPKADKGSFLRYAITPLGITMVKSSKSFNLSLNVDPNVNIGLVNNNVL